MQHHDLITREGRSAYPADLIPCSAQPGKGAGGPAALPGGSDERDEVMQSREDRTSSSREGRPTDMVGLIPCPAMPGKGSGGPVTLPGGKHQHIVPDVIPHSAANSACEQGRQCSRPRISYE